MRPVFILIGILLTPASASVGAAQTTALSATPKPVTMTQLRNISSLEGQLIQVTALVRHTDTAQVFTFGEKQGPEVHVVVPHPATDAANVGDMVALTGFVRRFSGGDFERDYSWFRRADYPDVRCHLEYASGGQGSVGAA